MPALDRLFQRRPADRIGRDVIAERRAIALIARFEEHDGVVFVAPSRRPDREGRAPRAARRGRQSLIVLVAQPLDIADSQHPRIAERDVQTFDILPEFTPGSDLIDGEERGGGPEDRRRRLHAFLQFMPDLRRRLFEPRAPHVFAGALQKPGDDQRERHRPEQDQKGQRTARPQPAAEARRHSGRREIGHGKSPLARPRRFCRDRRATELCRARLLSPPLHWVTRGYTRPVSSSHNPGGIPIGDFLVRASDQS